MMDVVAQLVRVLESSTDVALTDDQRAHAATIIQSQFGGNRVYIPKRAARPSGNMLSELRIEGVRPASFVRSVRERYQVSRATAYRWVRGA